MKKFRAKQPTALLSQSIPFTIIIETWGAFDEMKFDFGNGLYANFGNNFLLQTPFRTRLEWCLETEKEIFMEESSENTIWILKPSVTNKGADITIINQWSELLDVLENLSEIREWVLQK